MAINFQRLADANVSATPYPHLVLGDAIDPRVATSVARDFPLIEAAGAIRVDNTSPGAAFTDLLDDLRSDRFRAIIERKFDLDLDGKEIVINVRGLSRWTDGNIHTDTPSKLVTVLLYFNQPDKMTATTGLRILKNDYDIEDYAVEVPPVLGNLVAFKVTPDCWHGFKPYQGARHSLQLNYLSGVKSARKHEAGRRLVRHAARRAHGVQIAARTVVRNAERDVGALWLAAWDSRTPWFAKAVAGFCALFAISPVDLSPDFLPVVGHLDDLAILALGTFVTARLVPEPLMSELRTRAEASNFALARQGAAAMLVLWFAAFGMAWLRATVLA